MHFLAASVLNLPETEKRMAAPTARRREKSDQASEPSIYILLTSPAALCCHPEVSGHDQYYTKPTNPLPTLKSGAWLPKNMITAGKTCFKVNLDI